MGNFCPRESPSSMVWAGDDRELSAMENHDMQPPQLHQKMLLGNLSSSPKRLQPRGGSTTEVKIKITKKELNEFLRKAEAQNLSSEQILIGIIEASSGCYTVNHHVHHWKPELTSIPEVN
ncbi:hypothetical protein SAY86_025743 [Trapa natans]|uniref:Uncharacterized protein n=1 Tax=Trapa natans TaxID=22666 RepID=A0AAN7K9P9_TRANT|nr:hypothetical protein SAY86_025743 [Trapa natans]